MLPFGVTIPSTVPQRSEIPEGLMNYPVYKDEFADTLYYGLAVWYSAIWRLKSSAVKVQIAFRLQPTVLKTVIQWVPKTCVLCLASPLRHTSTSAVHSYFLKDALPSFSSVIPNLGPNTKLRAMYSITFAVDWFSAISVGLLLNYSTSCVWFFYHRRVPLHSEQSTSWDPLNKVICDGSHFPSIEALVSLLYIASSLPN